MAVDFTKMSLSQLAAWYNERAERPVKKFADKKTAIRRCEEISGESELTLDLDEEKKAEAAPVNHVAPQRKGKALLEAAAKETTARIIRNISHKGVKRTLSEAIAESWKVPDTAAKRRERNGCRVDGVFYPSVKQAFIDLELPLEKHIRFRMKLKEKGAIVAFGSDWEVV